MQKSNGAMDKHVWWIHKYGLTQGRGITGLTGQIFVCMNFPLKFPNSNIQFLELTTDIGSELLLENQANGNRTNDQEQTKIDLNFSI